jgi:outer membrane protein assembly factor BamB
MKLKASRETVELLASLIPAVLVALLGIVCLRWWFSFEPAQKVIIFRPGLDGAPQTEGTGSAGTTGQSARQIIRIGEHFATMAEMPPESDESWPRFRGPSGNNISSENVTLASSWPDGGPEVLWSVDLGEGHAAPAIHNGRAYLLDYDESEKADSLRCFSLSDGREIWRRWYNVPIKRNHGMSRTIPAVSDAYVVTVGPLGHVMCVDAETGELKWGIDMKREFGAEIPLWYTGQCPLIDEGVAVLAPGGSSLLIGIDCETGQAAWETANPMGWLMSHSSVMTMNLDGTRMYVYSALGGIVGVSAESRDRGRILWQTSEWNPKVAAPSPVSLEDGRVFATAGYGAGSMMLEISRAEEGFSVRSLYSHSPKDGLACEQQTPVFYNGHLFGILPKDAGALRNQFVCSHPDGRIVWSSGKKQRYGLGPFLIADGKILILSDEGVLTMIDASIESFNLLAQSRVLDGRDAWGPMALAGGFLLLRDSSRMYCLDLR